jgi:succinate-acetate transporter protein
MQEKLANPTPLGLITFGLSTVLLSLANAGVLDAGGAPIIAQALFVGGVAQMLSGIMEFVKGNTFGCVVFTSFGSFWISVAAFGILPKLGWAADTSNPVAGTFMLLWGIYVFLLFLGVYKARVLTLVVGSLFVLLFLLAIFYYSQSPAILTIAGWEGVLCGASAIYLGAAITLEETTKKKVLPF